MIQRYNSSGSSDSDSNSSNTMPRTGKNNNSTISIGTRMMLRIVFVLLVVTIATTKDTCCFAYVASSSSVASSLSLAFVTKKVSTETTTRSRLFSSITSPSSSRSSSRQHQSSTTISSKSIQRQIINPSPTSSTTISKTTTTTSSKRVVAVQTPITSIEQFQQFVTTSKSSSVATSSISPRYTIIKFYATWCKTCAKFSLKYDKLVAKHSDWIVLDNEQNQESQQQEQLLHRIGTFQFGTIEYSKCRSIFTTLNVTTLPTIHIYDPYGIKVIDISVPPSKFDQIITIINSFVSTSTSTSTNDLQHKEHLKGDEYQNQFERQTKLPLKLETILEEQQQNLLLDTTDTVQQSNNGNKDNVDDDKNTNKKNYNDNDIETYNNSDNVDEELFHHHTDTDTLRQVVFEDDDYDECQLEFEVDTTISHQAALDVSYHSRSFDECKMLQQRYDQEQKVHQQHHETTYNQEQQLLQPDHEQRRPSWWRQIPKVVRIVWTKTVTSNRL